MTRFISNGKKNDDIAWKVNIGGTPTEVARISGTTGAWTFGTSTTMQTVNGTAYNFTSTGSFTTTITSAGSGSSVLILNSPNASGSIDEVIFQSAASTRWRMMAGQSAGGLFSGYTSDNLAWYNDATGAVVGSITPAGAWTFGPAFPSTAVHSVRGDLTISEDGTHKATIITDSTSAYLDASHFWNFRVNGASSLLNAGQISVTGGWTLGPALGDAHHTIQGSGLSGQLLNIACTGGNPANVTIAAGGGSNNVVLSLTPGASGQVNINNTQGTTVNFQLNGTTSGSLNGNGWTLGATTGDLTHVVQNSSTVANLSVFKNLNTTTSSDAIYNMVMRKGSTSNGAGVNRFIVFQINNGGTDSGYIGTNGASQVGFFTLSDRRAKTDIVSLDSTLSKISQLNPVNFTWKSTGERAVGFIAQELAEVLPQFVSKTDSGKGTELPEGQDPWHMTESGFTAYLVKAIQELKALNDQLTADNDQLKAYKVQSEDRLATMEVRLSALEVK